MSSHPPAVSLNPTGRLNNLEHGRGGAVCYRRQSEIRKRALTFLPKLRRERKATKKTTNAHVPGGNVFLSDAAVHTSETGRIRLSARTESFVKMTCFISSFLFLLAAFLFFIFRTLLVLSLIQRIGSRGTRDSRGCLGNGMCERSQGPMYGFRVKSPRAALLR